MSGAGPQAPAGATDGQVGRGAPLLWVPSLYFVQGLQFFVVMLIAGLMFKNLGVPNEQIARWTGLIGLAWAFKPLWSPFLELVRSQKRVVVAMQALGALLLGAVALALQTPAFFALTVALLFVLAYAAATHDIACDGLYMASLSSTQQAAYAGWQGAFFNASKFLTLGLLVVWAGQLEQQLGVQAAWSWIFVGLAALLAALAAWNAFALPTGVQRAAGPGSARQVWQTLREVVADFLRKPQIGRALLFIVLFRFAEGQVQTIGPLFLLEPRAQGGLGLSTAQMGAIYGGVGTAAFLVGSILGGAFAARLGLRRAMPLLILAMAVPNAVFAWLGHARPELDAGWALPAALAGQGLALGDWTLRAPTHLSHITGAVAVEMLGYGFGFVGMILFLMQVLAPGRFLTAHYALGTGVMQLGFIFSKAISGDLQAWMGYQRFFDWTVLAGLPVLALLAWIRWPDPADTPR